jgi:hypothetical protein
VHGFLTQNTHFVFDRGFAVHLKLEKLGRSKYFVAAVHRNIVCVIECLVVSRVLSMRSEVKRLNQLSSCSGNPPDK